MEPFASWMNNVFFPSVKDKRDSILEEAKSLIDAQENPK